MNPFGRTTLPVATLALIAATGCRDLGLPGNIPLDAALHAPPPALVTEVVPARRAAVPDPVIVDNRRWVPWGTARRIPPDLTRPVAVAAGRTFHALAWDHPPYDRLFAPIDQQHWREYRSLDGGPPAATGR